MNEAITTYGTKSAIIQEMDSLLNEMVKIANSAYANRQQYQEQKFGTFRGGEDEIKDNTDQPDQFTQEMVGKQAPLKKRFLELLNEAKSKSLLQGSICVPVVDKNEKKLSLETEEIYRGSIQLQEMLAKEQQKTTSTVSSPPISNKKRTLLSSTTYPVTFVGKDQKTIKELQNKEIYHDTCQTPLMKIFDTDNAELIDAVLEEATPDDLNAPSDFDSDVTLSSRLTTPQVVHGGLRTVGCRCGGGVSPGLPAYRKLTRLAKAMDHGLIVPIKELPKIAECIELAQKVHKLELSHAQAITFHEVNDKDEIERTCALYKMKHLPSDLESYENKLILVGNKLYFIPPSATLETIEEVRLADPERFMKELHNEFKDISIYTPVFLSYTNARSLITSNGGYIVKGLQEDPHVKAELIKQAKKWDAPLLIRDSHRQTIEELGASQRPDDPFYGRYDSPGTTYYLCGKGYGLEIRVKKPDITDMDPKKLYICSEEGHGWVCYVLKDREIKKIPLPLDPSMAKSLNETACHFVDPTDEQARAIFDITSKEGYGGIHSNGEWTLIQLSEEEANVFATMDSDLHRQSPYEFGGYPPGITFNSEGNMKLLGSYSMFTTVTRYHLPKDESGPSTCGQDYSTELKRLQAQGEFLIKWKNKIELLLNEQLGLHPNAPILAPFSGASSSAVIVAAATSATSSESKEVKQESAIPPSDSIKKETPLPPVGTVAKMALLSSPKARTRASQSSSSSSSLTPAL